MSLLPINESLVNELRTKIESHFQEVDKGRYHTVDVERAKSDDYWLWRFLVHQRLNVHEAKSLLIETLKWRNDFGVNEIKEKEFPQLIDDIGAMYKCNHDNEGHRIIVMHVRRYRKEPIIAKLIQRYFVFQLEKLEKEDPLHPVSILFDMQNAGLSNVDMEFLSFMTTCFKSYYPCGVARILAFDMPWLFSAIWKIVKGWMSDGAQKKIKFVNKKTILEFVNEDQLLVEFGGSAEQIREFPFDYLLVK